MAKSKGKKKKSKKSKGRKEKSKDKINTVEVDDLESAELKKEPTLEVIASKSKDFLAEDNSTVPFPRNDAPYCDKKVAFMKYISSSGVKVAVVRALVALFEEPERTSTPLELMLEFLGAGSPSPAEIQDSQDEIAKLRYHLNDLETENEDLTTKIKELEALLGVDTGTALGEKDSCEQLISSDFKW